MTDRLAILVWAADPGSPHLCATPFYFAAAAAVMDAEVEMYFTARSVLLLAPGVAESLFAGGTPARDGTGAGPSVASLLADAARFGTRFLACPAAMAAHGLTPAMLRPEVAGQAGAAAFIGRALDPDWRTLCF